MKTALIAVLAFCALLYAGDYAVVRCPIPRSRNPRATVEVQPYYACPLKDGKTEFMFLNSENQVCVRSLFPHLGHNPCWYVRRHRNKATNFKAVPSKSQNPGGGITLCGAACRGEER